ncbi:MAG: hypothetical protein ACRD00_03225 [Thermoanaerobaculia bacterium]
MPTLADWIALFRRFVKKILAVLGWVPPTLARVTIGWIFLHAAPSK